MDYTVKAVWTALTGIQTNALVRVVNEATGTCTQIHSIQIDCLPDGSQIVNFVVYRDE